MLPNESNDVLIGLVHDLWRAKGHIGVPIDAVDAVRRLALGQQVPIGMGTTPGVSGLAVSLAGNRRPVGALLLLHHAAKNHKQKQTCVK